MQNGNKVEKKCNKVFIEGKENGWKIYITILFTI
jgi:hypothetical protein